MDFDAKDGKVSEWNEGNLKSLRLHEAQELINISKMQPLEMVRPGIFNYDVWISGIDILEGEGCAKWSAKENEQGRVLKNLVHEAQTKKRPHKLISSASFGKETKAVTFNEILWYDLKRLIQIYEKLVKEFNDKHGLSTKNRGVSGMFG